MKIITKDEGKSSAKEFLNELKFQKSAFLYGSILTDFFKPEYSDINLLVVVPNIDSRLITETSMPVQKYYKEKRLTTLILSEAELQDFSKEYPIKFIDIQGNYSVMEGADLLKDIHIEWSDLKKHAKHELLNFKMKLRKSLLYNYPQEFVLKSHLSQYLPQIISLLKIMVIAPESLQIDADDTLLNLLLQKKSVIDELKIEELVELYEKIIENSNLLQIELTK